MGFTSATEWKKTLRDLYGQDKGPRPVFSTRPPCSEEAFCCLDLTLMVFKKPPLCTTYTEFGEYLVRLTGELLRDYSTVVLIWDQSSNVPKTKTGEQKKRDASAAHQLKRLQEKHPHFVMDDDFEVGGAFPVIVEKTKDENGEPWDREDKSLSVRAYTSLLLSNRALRRQTYAWLRDFMETVFLEYTGDEERTLVFDAYPDKGPLRYTFGNETEVEHVKEWLHGIGETDLISSWYHTVAFPDIDCVDITEDTDKLGIHLLQARQRISDGDFLSRIFLCFPKKFITSSRDRETYDAMYGETSVVALQLQHTKFHEYVDVNRLTRRLTRDFPHALYAPESVALLMILSGTDFVKKVPGIGPKVLLNHYREHHEHFDDLITLFTISGFRINVRPVFRLITSVYVTKMKKSARVLFDPIGSSYGKVCRWYEENRKSVSMFSKMQLLGELKRVAWNTLYWYNGVTTPSLELPVLGDDDPFGWSVEGASNEFALVLNCPLLSYPTKPRKRKQPADDEPPRAAKKVRK